MKKRTSFIRDGVTVIYEDGILDAEIPLGDGVAKWFYENGAIKAEVPKFGGKNHGIARGWHDNGRLESETTYENGNIVGISRDWSKDGLLLHEMEYFSPNAIYAKNYSRRNKIRHIFLWNGKPISKTKWLKKLETAGISSKADLERKFPSHKED